MDDKFQDLVEQTVGEGSGRCSYFLTCGINYCSSDGYPKRAEEIETALEATEEDGLHLGSRKKWLDTASLLVHVMRYNTANY